MGGNCKGNFFPVFQIEKVVYEYVGLCLIKHQSFKTKQPGRASVFCQATEGQGIVR